MTFLSVVFATVIVQQQGTPYQLNQEVIRLLAQERNADALAVSRKAVRAAKVSLGSDNPAYAMILRNLALAYQCNGSYNNAEAAAKRSLAILEAAFGANDVSLTPVLNVLAETYAAEGRLAEARTITKRAVAIGPDAGAHYATALHNLGAIFELEGRLAEAREQYRRAVTSRADSGAF